MKPLVLVLHDDDCNPLINVYEDIQVVALLPDNICVNALKTEFDDKYPHEPWKEQPDNYQQIVFLGHWIDFLREKGFAVYETPDFDCIHIGCDIAED